jgi:hypothetical protein
MAEQFWPMNMPSSVGRACAQDDVDSAEVFRVAGCGFHQGQERNPLGPDVWGTDAKSCEEEFWVQEYFVSMVGRDEATIRDYSHT